MTLPIEDGTGSDTAAGVNGLDAMAVQGITGGVPVNVAITSGGSSSGTVVVSSGTIAISNSPTVALSAGNTVSLTGTSPVSLAAVPLAALAATTTIQTTQQTSLTSIQTNLTPRVNFAATQVTVGTTAVSLVAARATRQYLLVQNTSANPIYIGIAGVTATTGYLVAASMTLKLELFQGLLYAISTTAGSVVNVAEVY